ncbi:MAG: sugar phosphate nucleotidyltransferase [Gammaproteobacteria bacterium]
MNKGSDTAVILVGGKGTRLSHRLNGLPKSMAPIGGQPFIQLLIDQVVAAGIRDIYLLAGHKHEHMSNYFQNHPAKANITLHIEPYCLGTAGALKYAEPLLSHLDDFILMNGDTFNSANNIIQVTNANLEGAIGTLGIQHVMDATRYASIEVDDESRRITNYAEKQHTGEGFVAGGISKWKRDIFEHIQENENISFENTTLPGLIKKNTKISSLVLDHPFIDIGTPEAYDKFRLMNSSVNLV